MKDYEDEAFDELEKSLQRKVTHGVTDGNKKDAALRLALEALKNIVNAVYVNSQQEADAVYKANDVIKALEEALRDV